MQKMVINMPFLSDLEKKYVIEVLESNWLSSNGKHTKILEKKFAAYLGLKYCVAVQSGTAALHVSLKALGVGRGDFVIIPNYSCGASISSVIQCGAFPVVMDVEPDTFGLDASHLEDAIKKYKPKSLQLVHIYGYPARDTIIINEICKKYGVFIIEDASEALGAKLNDKMLGNYGDIAIYSIRSEKMIGIGEGGIVATNNAYLHEKVLLLSSRSAPFRDRDSPYWAKYYFDGEGYNYLLPHLLGAVGRAQIERFNSEIFPQKQRVGMIYRELFSDIKGIKMQKILSHSSSAFWLNTLIFENLTKNEVRSLGQHLFSQGIEIRSGFWPLSDMSAFRPIIFGTQEVGYHLFYKLVVLPSAYCLTKENVSKIRDIILDFLKMGYNIRQENLTDQRVIRLKKNE